MNHDSLKECVRRLKASMSEARKRRDDIEKLRKRRDENHTGVALGDGTLLGGPVSPEGKAALARWLKEDERLKGLIISGKATLEDLSHDLRVDATRLHDNATAGRFPAEVVRPLVQKPLDLTNAEKVCAYLLRAKDPAGAEPSEDDIKRWHNRVARALATAYPKPLTYDDLETRAKLRRQEVSDALQDLRKWQWAEKMPKGEGPGHKATQRCLDWVATKTGNLKAAKSPD
jgi:hypothetical protein